MKKAPKKLRLNRESLLVLDRVEMAQVAGGTGATDMQNSCGSVCYTDKSCNEPITQTAA